MKYSFFHLSKDEGKMMMPPHVAMMMEDRSVQILGAFDDSKSLCGYMVIQRIPGIEDKLYIRYVEVAKQYRKKGYVDDLFFYARRHFSKQGVNKLICVGIGGVLERNLTYRFMIKHGFAPYHTKGHFLVYSLESMEKSYMTKYSDALGKLKYLTKSRKQLEDEEFDNFEKKIRAAGYSADLTQIDPMYSRFYLENNDVRGFLQMELIAENILYLPSTWLDTRVDEAKAIMAMSVACMDIARERLDKEKTWVVLQLFKANGYNGVKHMFGEPDVDMKIDEYVKSI